MSQRDRDAVGAGIVVVFGALSVVVLVVLVAYGVATAVTKSECLRLGYPGAQVDVTFSRYCIARVDQTDVVVPLSEARMRR